MSELFSFPIASQVPGSVGAVAGSRVGGAIAKATARRAALDAATASRTIGREEDGTLSRSQVSTTSEGASSDGAMQAEDGADARRGASPRPERRAGSALAIPLEIVPELRWHLERGRFWLRICRAEGWPVAAEQLPGRVSQGVPGCICRCLLRSHGAETERAQSKHVPSGHVDGHICPNRGPGTERQTLPTIGSEASNQSRAARRGAIGNNPECWRDG
jgi:hypothetical protein